MAQRSHSRAALVAFALLALFLWALVGLLLWAALGNTWYGWVSEDWPVAEGRVVGSRVEEIRTNKERTSSGTALYKQNPSRTIIRYRPVVEYQWTVDAMTFKRDRRNFSAAVADEDTRVAAEALIEPYPVGASVDIHYDPEQPSRGILEPGPHWGGTGVALFAALFLCAFASVFSVLAYRRR